MTAILAMLRVVTLAAIAFLLCVCPVTAAAVPDVELVTAAKGNGSDWYGKTPDGGTLLINGKSIEDNGFVWVEANGRYVPMQRNLLENQHNPRRHRLVNASPKRPAVSPSPIPDDDGSLAMVDRNIDGDAEADTATTPAHLLDDENNAVLDYFRRDSDYHNRCSRRAGSVRAWERGCREFMRSNAGRVWTAGPTVEICRFKMPDSDEEIVVKGHANELVVEDENDHPNTAGHHITKAVDWLLQRCSNCNEDREGCWFGGFYATGLNERFIVSVQGSGDPGEDILVDGVPPTDDVFDYGYGEGMQEDAPANVDARDLMPRQTPREIQCNWPRGGVREATDHCRVYLRDNTNKIFNADPWLEICHYHSPDGEEEFRLNAFPAPGWDSATARGGMISEALYVLVKDCSNCDEAREGCYVGGYARTGFQNNFWLQVTGNKKKSNNGVVAKARSIDGDALDIDVAATAAAAETRVPRKGGPKVDDDVLGDDINVLIWPDHLPLSEFNLTISDLREARPTPPGDNFMPIDPRAAPGVDKDITASVSCKNRTQGAPEIRAAELCRAYIQNIPIGSTRKMEAGRENDVCVVDDPGNHIFRMYVETEMQDGIDMSGAWLEGVLQHIWNACSDCDDGTCSMGGTYKMSGPLPMEVTVTSQTAEEVRHKEIEQAQEQIQKQQGGQELVEAQREKLWCRGDEC